MRHQVSGHGSHPDLVLDEHRVAVEAEERAVQGHDGQATPALARKVAVISGGRNQQQAGDPLAHQQLHIFPLGLEALVRRAEQHRIAPPPGHPGDTLGARGEERVGNVGDDEPDGAGRAELESPGNVIAAVAKPEDGLLDAVPTSGRTYLSR